MVEDDSVFSPPEDLMDRLVESAMEALIRLADNGGSE
jgi:hypothetical protein